MTQHRRDAAAERQPGGDDDDDDDDERPLTDSNDHDPLYNPPPELEARQARRAARRRDALAARRRRLDGAWDDALLAIIPLRLGLKALEATYVPQLLAALRLPQSAGVLGGRPRAALFFPGFARDDAGAYRATGFDPHTVQPALVFPDDAFVTEAHLASATCADPKKMALERLDPSLAVAFYCRDRADFLDLAESAATLAAPGQTPIFDVAQTADGRPGDVDGFDDDDDDDDDGQPGGRGDDEDDWEVV